MNRKTKRQRLAELTGVLKKGDIDTLVKSYVWLTVAKHGPKTEIRFTIPNLPKLITDLEYQKDR